MRDWKGWENSGPMKSVDAVVKEHRLFIVLVIFKKSGHQKENTYNTCMLNLLFGYFLFTYNLIKKRVLLDLNVLKKVGIIPISHKSLSATYIKS